MPKKKGRGAAASSSSKGKHAKAQARQEKGGRPGTARQRPPLSDTVEAFAATAARLFAVAQPKFNVKRVRMTGCVDRAVATGASNLAAGGRQQQCRQPPPAAVFTLHPVLLPTEAAALVAAAERHSFTLTKQRASKYMAHRENGRIQFCGPDLSAVLWERVRRWFPDEAMDASELDDGTAASPPRKGRQRERQRQTRSCSWHPVGLSDNWRLYRYTPGERFGMHVDESVTTSTGHHTRYTLLFYLNGGGLSGDGGGGGSVGAGAGAGAGAGDGGGTYGPAVVGGETAFYSGHDPKSARLLVKVAPSCGTALAHLHGDDCLLHEGCEVHTGVKYLLRTDVAYELREEEQEQREEQQQY